MANKTNSNSQSSNSSPSNANTSARAGGASAQAGNSGATKMNNAEGTGNVRANNSPEVSGNSNPKVSNKERAKENAQGAAQGAVEGLKSSSGSGNNSNGKGSTNPKATVDRAKNDAAKAKQLKENVKNGNLQRGMKEKGKQMAKNPSKALDKEDSKNVTKGAVQYAKGDYEGLAETAADEANHVSDQGAAAKEKDKNKFKDDDKSAKASNSNSDKDQKGKDQKDKSKKSDNKDDENSDDKKDQEDEEKDKKKQQNAAKTGAAAAWAGIKAALALQAAAFLKMMLSLLMAAAHAVATAIATIIAAAVQALATIAVALGVTMAVAVGGVVGVVVIGVLAIVGIFASSSDDTAAAREGYLDDDDPCVVKEDDSSTTVAVEGDVTERAQKVYSFFKNYGYTDEMIAGILGCWVKESGIDCYAIEGLSGKSGTDEWQNAFNDLDTYTYNLLLNGYYIGTGSSTTKHGYSLSAGQGAGSTSVNSSGYVATESNGQTAYYCGLGLGQWTGPRALELILMAQNAGLNWYDMDTQLAYMISVDSRADWVASWASSAPSTASECCSDFATGWEGFSGDVTSRQTVANEYMAYFGEWTADANYYNTIIEIAGDAAKLSGETASSSDDSSACKDSTVQGYGDGLAERMAAYCFTTREESVASYTAAGGSADNGPAGIVCGTDLYIKVHQTIEGIRDISDDYYASCDRGVGYAILWSGADDDVTFGGVYDLKNHLESCPHWEEVDCSSIDDLQPGDIVLYCEGRDTDGDGVYDVAVDGDVNGDGKLSSAHVIMYIGEEAVKKYHDSDLVFGSASYGDRPANLSGDSFPDIYRHVYRNVQTESDSKYVNIDVD